VIASLTGLVQSTQANSIVLDVSGVGYLLNVTSRFANAATVGEQAFVHTTLVVREDAMTLFGFETVHERELFDSLRSVTGVGPKSSLAILGSLSTDQIFDAVASESDDAFRSVSGIGPKTAKLIVVSLAGKLRVSPSGSSKSSNGNEDLVEALVGLGYQEKTARLAIAEVAQPADLPQQIIKKALALLSSPRGREPK
jgi:Holliday junction DNA helicase RuvA